MKGPIEEKGTTNDSKSACTWSQTQTDTQTQEFTFHGMHGIGEETQSDRTESGWDTPHSSRAQSPLEVYGQIGGLPSEPSQKDNASSAPDGSEFPVARRSEHSRKPRCEEPRGRWREATCTSLSRVNSSHPAELACSRQAGPSRSQQKAKQKVSRLPETLPQVGQ